MKHFSLITLFSLFSLIVSQVYAVEVPIQTELENAGVQLDLGRIVSAGVNIGILLGAVALLGYFVLGAYRWMNSEGDASKVQEARQTFTNGLIGMTILASVLALYSIIDGFFGIGITTQEEYSPTLLTPSNPSQGDANGNF